jgi:FkbM family methyltransferase
MPYFRPGTNDQDIYTLVVHHTEYRLPKCFQADDIVIDVGAHIGFFTEAVLQRGCRKVYSIEADEENIQVARQNLQPFIDQGKVVVIHGALWRSDPNDDVLYFDRYPHLAGFPGGKGLINTGGGGVMWPTGETVVPKIAFDSFLLEITGNGAHRVRLLKLDCEGSEWPILFTAKTLHLIDEICGEFHELGGSSLEISRERPGQKPVFSVNGCSWFTVADLVGVLNQAGFGVTYRRHRHPTGEMEGLGLFFATHSDRQHL